MEQNIGKYVGNKIKEFRKLKGYTQKELGEKVGVKHNTISSYENGTNEPEQNMIFAIANALDVKVGDLFPPVNNPFEDNNLYPVGEMVDVPVFGTVSCGEGSVIYEPTTTYETTPKSWVKSGEFFYLRAKGDSMIGARVHEGDLLLIRKQEEVENGEIAAVVIDDEIVLKRVYKDNGSFTLISENANYAPRKFDPKTDRNIRILGKLKKAITDF